MTEEAVEGEAEAEAVKVVKVVEATVVEMGAVGRGAAAREGVRVVETVVETAVVKAVTTAESTAESTAAEARAAGVMAGLMVAAREGTTAAEATAAAVVVTAATATATGATAAGVTAAALMAAVVVQAVVVPATRATAMAVTAAAAMAAAAAAVTAVEKAVVKAVAKVVVTAAEAMAAAARAAAARTTAVICTPLCKCNAFPSAHHNDHLHSTLQHHNGRCIAMESNDNSHSSTLGCKHNMNNRYSLHFLLPLQANQRRENAKVAASVLVPARCWAGLQMWI